MRQTFRARRACAAALLCAGLVLAAAVHAQAWPSRAVRVIVPFPPGGPADVMGRTYAEKLSARWGQPVVIDNRAGAAGNIGAEIAAKSPPDGYTLILIANAHVINASLYSKLPYDPVKDFTPISEVTYYALMLVAHPSVQAATVKELVALAKAEPGKLSVVSAGNGTSTHLARNCSAASPASTSSTFPTKAPHRPPMICWRGRGS